MLLAGSQNQYQNSLLVKRQTDNTTPGVVTDRTETYDPVLADIPAIISFGERPATSASYAYLSAFIRPLDF